MVETSQDRAIRTYRARLTQRGLKRFEITALEMDRDLLRSLARRLSEDGPEAAQARAAVQAVVTDQTQAGGILAALRCSPLVGADLDLSRSHDEGRKVDL